MKSIETASESIAVGFARGLVIDAEGAGALLDLVEQGRVSARVLQNGKVQRLMSVNGLPNGVSRMKALVVNLPSLDAQTRKLIVNRWLEFQKATPSVVVNMVCR